MLVKIQAIVTWLYDCQFLKAVSLGRFYCWLQNCVVSFACCLESGLSMTCISYSLPEASADWCCWCILTIWKLLFYSFEMSEYVFLKYNLQVATQKCFLVWCMGKGALFTMKHGFCFGEYFKQMLLQSVSLNIFWYEGINMSILKATK